MTRQDLLSISFNWGIAIVFSAMLNLFLFGIMPGMIQKVPTTCKDFKDYKAVQVIRIKRPDSSIRKKEHKRDEPEKKKIKPIKKHIKIYKQKHMVLKPRLPFQLNAKLPDCPDSLKMPPLENFTMGSHTGIFMENQLDSPLIPLAKIPPLYPMRASRRGIEGWVKVRFIVNSSGLVENLEIIESKPSKIFDKSVMNCVSRWKFKPGTVEGIAVPTQAETTIRFKLE